MPAAHAGSRRRRLTNTCPRWLRVEGQPGCRLHKRTPRRIGEGPAIQPQVTVPPRTAQPPVQVRPSGLTDREERFVLRYLVDFDRRAAISEAGYNCTTIESQDALAARLLNSVKLRSFIVQKKAEYAANYELAAEQWFSHMRLVFLDAYESGRYADAVAALRELGKSLGVYEAHERQRHFTREDADRLEQELEARGYPRLERTHAPAHLKHGTGEQLRVTPTEDADGRAGTGPV